MNTKISRRIEWDMGHRIPDHESLCRNPHGHRYVAEVMIEGPINDTKGSPERGMVKDFVALKRLLGFIPAQYDHAFMVYHADPFAAALAQFDRQQSQNFAGASPPLRIFEVDFIPTAENIAAEIFRRVANNGAHVVEVTVWETPNCKAVVRR